MVRGNVSVESFKRRGRGKLEARSVSIVVCRVSYGTIKAEGPRCALRFLDLPRILFVGVEGFVGFCFRAVHRKRTVSCYFALLSKAEIMLLFF